ncbi:MAG: ribonuclease III [bacterium]
MNQQEIITFIEEKLRYSFKDKNLLETSITHRSYLNQGKFGVAKKEHNERLEFLGDAVLEIIVTDYLFKNFTEPEGHLTALRAALVNYKLIGSVGLSLGLSEVLYVSKGERSIDGDVRLSIVADAVEAVIGAMYLDGGLSSSSAFVEANILTKLPEIINQKTYKDDKTKLQEYVQKYLKETPKYKIISTSGKDHDRAFVCGVFVSNELVVTGEGRSKQDAEVVCAKDALTAIKEKFKIVETEQ